MLTRSEGDRTSWGSKSFTCILKILWLPDTGIEHTATFYHNAITRRMHFVVAANILLMVPFAIKVNLTDLFATWCLTLKLFFSYIENSTIKISIDGGQNLVTLLANEASGAWVDKECHDGLRGWYLNVCWIKYI